MKPLIMPGAQPFYFPGGLTGIVLIHGFTGAPNEMLWMGEYLAHQGNSVLGIRLAGHGTTPADMLRIRWQDWLVSVEDGVSLLQKSTRRVYLMGLSLGGALALLGAAYLPVQGVVAMSAPYRMPPDPRLPFVRLLYPFVPRQPKGPGDFQNQAAAANHVDYPYYPTKAIAELVDCLQALRQALPQVQAPALLIHSRLDQGVVPQNMEDIYAALGSRDKQKLWLERSGHVVTREPERELVFAAARAFIDRTQAAG